jgi:hypothetical protein
MLAGKGHIMDQLATDGLHSHSIRDLQDVTLEELTRQAQDGDSSIQAIVNQMIDDGHGQPTVDVTKFNSSIA